MPFMKHVSSEERYRANAQALERIATAKAGLLAELQRRGHVVEVDNPAWDLPGISLVDGVNPKLWFGAYGSPTHRRGQVVQRVRMKLGYTGVGDSVEALEPPGGFDPVQLANVLLEGIAKVIERNKAHAERNAAMTRVQARRDTMHVRLQGEGIYDLAAKAQVHASATESGCTLHMNGLTPAEAKAAMDAVIAVRSRTA